MSAELTSPSDRLASFKLSFPEDKYFHKRIPIPKAEKTQWEIEVGHYCLDETWHAM